MSVAVLVPLGVDPDGWRSAAFEFLTARYQRDHPDWPVSVGTASAGGPAGAPGWSKGAALRQARENVRADVLIVADADCLVPDAQLSAAVHAVLAGASWSVPYVHVRRLKPEPTRQLLHTGGIPTGLLRATPDGILDRDEYVGVRGGGIVVLRSDVYDACPLDPRFRGWGGEDESWGLALTTLYGPSLDVEGSVWHLWHPHAVPGARGPLYPPSVELLRAYQSAAENPRLVRALVAGQVPDPPVPLDPPRRYRASTRVVRAARRNVYFNGQVAEVTDPDVAEVLDRTVGVTRVQS